MQPASTLQYRYLAQWRVCIFVLCIFALQAHALNSTKRLLAFVTNIAQTPVLRFEERRLNI